MLDLYFVFFFFKQKTAYEIYQCDWSSDVCSSDLETRQARARLVVRFLGAARLAPLALAPLAFDALFLGVRASASSSARSVRSQVKLFSVRPK